MTASTTSKKSVSKDMFKFFIPAASISSIVLCILGPLLFPSAHVLMLLVVYCFFTILSIGHAIKFRTTAYHIVETIRHALVQSPTATDLAYSHVFVIPNYKEPIGILKKTLLRLASHRGARENYVIVLAMEESEAGHIEKGAALEREFSRFFKKFMTTAHPADLPGEARGKGSNVNFAVRKASNILIKEHGMNMENLVLTISDADAAIPELYIQQIEENMQVAKDPYATVFCPPIFFSRNSNKVPAAVRVTDIMWSIMVMQNLSNGSGLMFPCSNYSLSMVLADRVNYWDTDFDAIGEDMHMMLKCFFKTGGHARAVPIYVPINLTNVQSDSYLSTVYARYVQASRHFYGVADVAYALDQSFKSFMKRPYISLSAAFDRLQLLFHMMEAHLIPVVTGWMLILGLLMLQTLNPHVFDGNAQFENLVHVLKIVSGLSSIPMVSNILAYERLHSIVDSELFYPQAKGSFSVDEDGPSGIPLIRTSSESTFSSTSMSRTDSSSTLLGCTGSDQEEEISEKTIQKPTTTTHSIYHPSKRTIRHYFDYAWLPFAAFFYMTLPSTISSMKKLIPNREEKYIVAEKMGDD